MRECLNARMQTISHSGLALGMVVDDRRECPQGGVQRPHEQPDLTDREGNAQNNIKNSLCLVWIIAMKN